MRSDITIATRWTMNLFLVLCSLSLIATSAFVPPSAAKRSTPPVTIQAEFYRSRGKPGGPVHKPPILDGTFAGDYGFDPLGLVRNKDALLWYREAEMKHARLSRERRPGPRRSWLWAFFFLLGAAVELQNYRAKEKTGYFPGNQGFDPLRLYPSDKFGQRRTQLAEIRNGRLAMVAVASYLLQEWVFKVGVVEQTPFLFKPIWNWWN